MTSIFNLFIGWSLWIISGASWPVIGQIGLPFDVTKGCP